MSLLSDKQLNKLSKEEVIKYASQLTKRITHIEDNLPNDYSLCSTCGFLINWESNSMDACSKCDKSCCDTSQLCYSINQVQYLPCCQTILCNTCHPYLVPCDVLPWGKHTSGNSYPLDIYWDIVSYLLCPKVLEMATVKKCFMCLEIQINIEWDGDDIEIYKMNNSFDNKIKLYYDDLLRFNFGYITKTHTPVSYLSIQLDNSLCSSCLVFDILDEADEMYSYPIIVNILEFLYPISKS